MKGINSGNNATKLKTTDNDGKKMINVICDKLGMSKFFVLEILMQFYTF